MCSGWGRREEQDKFPPFNCMVFLSAFPLPFPLPLNSGNSESQNEEKCVCVPLISYCHYMITATLVPEVDTWDRSEALDVGSRWVSQFTIFKLRVG